MARTPRRPADQTLGARIGYRIDRFLGLHPAVQLVAVLSSALVLALFFACVIWALDDSDGVAPNLASKIGNIPDGLWWAITRMLDGGTVANDVGPLRQVFGLAVTVVGLVAVAVLTGSFASSFSERLAAIRQGSLGVFEQGHTVLLGWNINAAVIVRELALSGVAMTIVVVSDRDREIIEESVREQLEGRAHRLRIVVRRGDPTTRLSVRRAAVRGAHAVLILPEPAGEAFADRAALRSLLAVRRAPGGRDRPVIVEASTASGRELITLCGGQGKVVVVEARGMNSRLIAQSVRRRGAFNVAQQLLSLDTRSIFLHEPDGFVGKTFDEAHAAIDAGILVGIARGSAAMLSPDGALVIAPSDHLLVFAAGNIPPRATGELPSVTVPARVTVGEAPLDVLVLRFRPELAEMLTFLDSRGAARVSVLVAPSDAARARVVLAPLKLARTEVEVIEGDPLDGVDIARALERRRDVALLLAPDVAVADIADADADQLITLLQLRRAGHGAPRSVVEFRSPETRHLTRTLAHREDFILKRETVGMLLAQELHAICLERAGAWVGPVYHALLEAIGPAVEFAPVAEYLPGRREATFGEIMAVARGWGQVAIGVAVDGEKPSLLCRREERFAVAGARVVVLEVGRDRL